MARITGRKRYLIEYLGSEPEAVLLRDVVRAGYGRALIHAAIKAGLVDIGSSYEASMATPIAEFARQQLTTCYVELTEAGREALAELRRN